MTIACASSCPLPNYVGIDGAETSNKVANLIRLATFTDEQIAGLADVSVDFVLQLRRELQAG